MHAAAMPRHEPSDAELAAAWGELLQRGRCRHATLADALAHSVSAAVIRLHARLAASGAHPFDAQSVRRIEPVCPPDPLDDDLLALRPPKRPQRRQPARPPIRASRQPPELHDRKRLAAGDRDDD